jgi:cytochrome c-type biogenesis protein CcmF
MQLGQSLQIGKYHVLFEGLRGSQQPTHYRVEGAFRIFNAAHDLGVVAPALKFFPNQESPVGRAVHRSSLSQDLYLILSGFSEIEQNRATLKVLVRPMVVWIWLGGAVLALGTLLAIWPFGRRPALSEA